MTELAAGAVSSLLLVVRNEQLLLGGVQDDVQFIKEEMESMKSFLAHLARSTPLGREHDEQVRTWMNQVRLLAQDCHNCIDLYLYSGNPHIHRAKGRLRRYLWWVYWFLRKLLARHRAAVQLRQLKDRARDVGERRLRYGVEVPGKSRAEQSPPTAGLAATASSSARGGYEAAAGDDNEEEEDGDDQHVSAAASRNLDDYVKAKLCEWIEGVTPNADESWSMVIVAPYTYQDLLALPHEIWVSNKSKGGIGYQHIVLIDIPAVHLDFMPLRAKEVLFYILCELKHAKSQPQEQEQGQHVPLNEKLVPRRMSVKKEQGGQGPHRQGEGETHVDTWEEVLMRKLQTYNEKKKALALLKIKENIKEMKVDEKLDKIKRDIQGQVGNSDRLPKYDQLHDELDKLDLDVLLQLLLQAAVAASQQDQGKNKDMDKLPAHIAKKLKEHMEAEEKGKTLEEEKVTKHMGLEAAGKNMEKDMMEGEGGEIAKHMEEGEGGRGGSGGEEIESQHTTRIHLDEAQYAHILQNLFPKDSSSSMSAPSFSDEHRRGREDSHDNLSSSATRRGPEGKLE